MAVKCDVDRKINSRETFKMKRLLLFLPGIYSLLTASERILEDGYPLEMHEVQTTDGYFLRVHRIPKEENNEVALFIHGFAASTDVFLVGGPTSAIIYQTADAGFDVWIPNLRGNKYSKKHGNLSTSDSRFWNFNLQEMAVYDIPAVVDFILMKTNQKQIHAIGHSQGTTVIYIWLSERPDYNQFVKSSQMISPVVYISHCVCPVIRIMVFFYGFLLPFQNTEFMPFDELAAKVKGDVCDVKSPLRMLCKWILDIIYGVDDINLNEVWF